MRVRVLLFINKWVIALIAPLGTALALGALALLLGLLRRRGLAAGCALLHFRAQGLSVHPGATDHEARTRRSPTDWLPSAQALHDSGRAIKEIVAYRLPR